MNVNRLKLVNVRAIEVAEFRFRSGFNLVAGVNGVGKTTVLDALAVCFSAITREANHRSRYGRYFDSDDIRLGVEALQVECDFECAGKHSGFVLHKSRERIRKVETAEWTRKKKKASIDDTIEEFRRGLSADENGGEPKGGVLTVLFSTNRSVASNQASRRDAAAGGAFAAFAGALSPRSLRLREFADWMRAKRELSPELPAAESMLAALDRSVARFLPEYRNLRVAEDNGKNTLLIDRGSTPLPVRHLSDGERGVLAIVLDLTRRLAQANPKMKDPAAEAEAVVLIDELELHLHPGWQRRIVGNLIETFPNCQFIATTHSPQIIGDVEHSRIHLMADGEVYSPTHSFGVDSSRVLEEIMDTESRNPEVGNLLKSVSRVIGNERYDDARELLVQLVNRVGESDPEVTRITTLLEFMEGEE